MEEASGPYPEVCIVTMPAVILERATEQRIAERARRSGMSEIDLIRTLIEEGLDDLGDIQMAVDRLDNHLQPLTSAQARKALGLED
jgi:predicted DNA-binding protein